MVQLFPAIEPYAHGLLDVGHGHRVYWETSGNPRGQAALCVHGGPGNGGHRESRRLFDPRLYRIVLFDQRGCGHSQPHASDPATSMAHNTTEYLIADMERLREHLGVQRWLLYGRSWGSTLILAYAQRYPERVSGIVIAGVTMTRPEEIDWLYRGVARFLPGAWEAFRDALPRAERDGDLVAGYDRMLNSPDEQARTKAARHWCAWEDAVIAHEPRRHPAPYSEQPNAAMLAFARICAHYFIHHAWLDDRQLLRDAHRLTGIAGVLIHGRLDLASPLATAWELAAAWPQARLQVIEDAGHIGSPAMLTGIVEAIAAFAERGD
ncbi:prolyl aminopeptidase [Salinactinospora qingdaonensis]|uniref:Proline iminopeptidase n=1 Tax=Salinactinospora qingdaonensis TaxID=702744 RepID=A0ABP7G354_9ACTN